MSGRQSDDHRTPTCKTYLGSTERRKKLVSLKKCPDCTQTHEGNCIVTYKCRICLDGSHLDYLCPGPKTPNAQKRLTDGVGVSSSLVTGLGKKRDISVLGFCRPMMFIDTKHRAEHFGIENSVIREHFPH